MRERLFVQLSTVVMRIISKSFEVSARKITHSFMSNIIREIFVEDHVQQVSTETLRDLNLLHRARDFKFCMSQAQKACENIRVF